MRCTHCSLSCADPAPLAAVAVQSAHCYRSGAHAAQPHDHQVHALHRYSSGASGALGTRWPCLGRPADSAVRHMHGAWLHGAIWALILKSCENPTSSRAADRARSMLGMLLVAGIRRTALAS